jgi:hypothetical protein
VLSSLSGEAGGPGTATRGGTGRQARFRLARLDLQHGERAGLDDTARLSQESVKIGEILSDTHPPELERYRPYQCAFEPRRQPIWRIESPLTSDGEGVKTSDLL